MDNVLDTFDFNDHAIRRFSEKLKDAIDPEGIIAPGKQGIWPRRLRSVYGASARLAGRGVSRSSR